VSNHFIAMIAAFALCQGAALAGEAPSAAADPVLEARVNKLSEELRCLVCQNQSLADSHAELAMDLKNQVREMLGKGMSDKEVTDYLVQRYGDFVLYRPPVKGTTWLLWGGPFLLLIAALAFFVAKVRRRADTAPLTQEEHATAQRLLNNDGKKS
jgi:cytochrome c-type biogenesis protein CcmH